MATAGSLPPLSTNGKTFINDPKITGSIETKASIKLKFLTPKDKEVIVVRNFQLSIKNKKYEFKRLEQILKSFNQAGELVTINSTCMDIDKQIPLLMHASKAIIENVIFCHQEEINWPFSEAGNLKKVFDEIFDTAKYTKALEDLKDTNKSFVAKSKELKTKIELIQKDFEQYNRINHQIDFAEKKISELNASVEELNKVYKKTSSDLEQILNLEKNFKEYENGINLAKAKRDEKNKQIETILSDPMFEDYTKDGTTYENYIKNYQDNMQMFSEVTTSEEKIAHIEKLTLQLRTLNEQINKIETNVISKTQAFNNYIANKKEMITAISSCEALELNVNQEMSLDDIKKKLIEKEEEINGKYDLLNEKLNQFSLKAIEKNNDIEVNKHLYESKCKEIEALENKKKELLNMISNVNSNNTKINEIDDMINVKRNEIERKNYEIKQCENDILALESGNSQLKLKLSSFGIESESQNEQNNINLFNFHMKKLSDFCLKFSENETKIISLILKINSMFGTKFICDKKMLIKSMDEITIYIKEKIEEVTEEKMKIREESLMLNLQIESEEKNKNKIENEILYFEEEKKEIIEGLKLTLQNYGVEIDNDDDFQSILDQRKKIELDTQNKEDEYKSLIFEKNYLEEYVEEINQNKTCPLCLKQATNTEILLITKQKKETIDVIDKKSKIELQELQSKTEMCNHIKQCDAYFGKFNLIFEQISKKKNEHSQIQQKIDNLFQKKKFFENSSKEKSKMLMTMNAALNSSLSEEIAQLKSQKIEIEQNIREQCEILKIQIINEIVIKEIITEAETKSLAINEIAKIEKSINENEVKLNKLSHSIASNLQILSKLTDDLSILEEKKKEILLLCNENEINKRISEIERDLSSKIIEKNELEKQNQSLSELKTVLDDKKEKFDALYTQKTEKYKQIQTAIANFKLKYQFITEDFSRTFPQDDSSTITSPERKFTEIINGLTTEKETIQNNATIISNELSKLSDEAQAHEKEKKQHQLRDNIYKNNLLLYKTKKEIAELTDYITAHESKLQAGNRLFYAKDLLTKKNTNALSSYNLNLGKLEELKSNLTRLNTEKHHDNYTNISKRYSKLKLEYILSLETTKQIENYYEALDQALLKYHGKRMEEINKLINYYWGMTYKGNDIKWIEIRSDFEKIGRSRNYNYRIVFGTNGGYELDMRGRCSAGQKILASIIIRLALAETFCNNCGILCLDEPTTNLDEEHSRALAKSLREIIQSRSEDQNFQLIVITHDPVFVDLIGNDFCDSFWQVAKGEDNFSDVKLKQINSIFGN